EELQPGWIQTFPTFGRYSFDYLPSGTLTKLVDFGNFKLISIDGQAFTDVYGDGSIFGDPGRPGVTVNLFRDANSNGVLDSGDAFVTSRMTGVGGYYKFADLGPGTYFV